MLLVPRFIKFFPFFLEMRLFESKYILNDDFPENAMKLVTEITQKWSLMSYRKDEGFREIRRIWGSSMYMRVNNRLCKEDVDKIISSNPKIEADWEIIKLILSKTKQSEEYYTQKLLENETEFKGDFLNIKYLISFLSHKHKGRKITSSFFDFSTTRNSFKTRERDVRNQRGVQKDSSRTKKSPRIGFRLK
jgi:hypothetical protein